ncbi:hypothetical protein VTJ04DRAFT_9193 [Mycothermus thermophilus]|uniref:uncharacterized protein n=1 Tax=Humicola insolens TaxID=85995 RepID=UPI0037442FB5
MAPTIPLLSHMLGARQEHEGHPSRVPLIGLVLGVVLSMLSISVLSAFTAQRYLAVKTWKQLPFVQWLVFCIYIDSFLFVLGTAIIQFGFGVGYSGSVCETAILLCLVFYVTAKVSSILRGEYSSSREECADGGYLQIFIYMFMVEKAYIIRSGRSKPRLKSKLYCFNSFGMIGVYIIVVVPNFIFRIARIDNGECIIGMERPAILPLIAFDLLVNVYLTILFLKPLYSLYAFKNYARSAGSDRLKTMAVRTFIGSVCTLTSSTVNLSVLVGLNGEPGWVCLMCCNSDILFGAVVIHWVTSRDSTIDGMAATFGTAIQQATGGGHGRKSGPCGGVGGGGGNHHHAASDDDELSVIPQHNSSSRGDGGCGGSYRLRDSDENDVQRNTYFDDDDDDDVFNDDVASMVSKTRSKRRSGRPRASVRITEVDGMGMMTTSKARAGTRSSDATTTTMVGGGDGTDATAADGKLSPQYPISTITTASTSTSTATTVAGTGTGTGENEGQKTFPPTSPAPTTAATTTTTTTTPSPSPSITTTKPTNNPTTAIITTATHTLFPKPSTRQPPNKQLPLKGVRVDIDYSTTTTTIDEHGGDAIGRLGHTVVIGTVSSSSNGKRRNSTGLSGIMEAGFGGGGRERGKGGRGGGVGRFVIGRWR